MSLGHIGNLETMHLMVTVPADGPQVEHVLNIFHGIDMSIDINIIIIGINSVYKLGFRPYPDASAFIDGTFLVLTIQLSIAPLSMS